MVSFPNGLSLSMGGSFDRTVVVGASFGFDMTMPTHLLTCRTKGHPIGIDLLCGTRDGGISRFLLEGNNRRDVAINEMSIDAESIVSGVVDDVFDLNGFAIFSKHLRHPVETLERQGGVGLAGGANRDVDRERPLGLGL